MATDPARARRIAPEAFCQVLDGIAHLQRHRIIHRDIKAENIVLGSRPDGGLTCKIADFGHALRPQDHATAVAAGTRMAMTCAARQASFDEFTDLFGLGCLCVARRRRPAS